LHQLFDFGHLLIALPRLAWPLWRLLIVPRSVRRTFVAVVVTTAAIASAAPRALICHMLDPLSRVISVACQLGSRTGAATPVCLYCMAGGCGAGPRPPRSAIIPAVFADPPGPRPHGDQFLGDGRMHRHCGVEIGLGATHRD